MNGRPTAVQNSVFSPRTTTTMSPTTRATWSQTVGGIQHGGMPGQPVMIDSGVLGVHQHQVPGVLVGVLPARQPSGVPGIQGFDPGVGVRHLGARSGQLVDDLQRRRLPDVGDAGLVGHADHQDAGPRVAFPFSASIWRARLTTWPGGRRSPSSPTAMTGELVPRARSCQSR